jgi:uncharacterized protein with WD repeat
VAFSPDGIRLASASLDRTVRIWDAMTGNERLTLKGHTGPVYGVAFSPDGTRLASASGDKTVRVWDAVTGHEALTLKGHKSAVQRVGFSADGRRLASASDNTVTVWDAVTGHEALTLKGHTEWVYCVAFSPDGTRLASGSGDRTVRVWDAVTGQERLTLKGGHTVAVYCAAFSPDGQRLASASVDKTVRVWDAVTGQETLTLEGHTGPVTSVAFSPDGTLLASASYDSTVKVWDARDVAPESRVRDEARGLVLFLVDRLATEPDLRDRIARDRTRSPAVRAAALGMVPSAWAMRIRRRAEAIVEPLFARLFLRDDVLATLQAEPTAEPELQAACLKLAETWTVSARECISAAFALVRNPRGPDALYQRGLRLAEAACRVEPVYGSYLNTLGVALYRAGLVAEALATLTRSNALNQEKKPADLAFLAMAHQRLSHPAQARAMLDRLRDVIRRGPEISQSAENRAFLAEAEAVVLYDPIFPGDPFAP